MECMALGESRTEELTDLIDEELCEDGSVTCFRDIAFTHPAFGDDICVYAFVNRIVPQLLLHPLTPLGRTQRAIRLLGHLERRLPARTRGVARLYLSVAGHLDEGVEERVRWERELAWWVGVEDADALRLSLVQALDNRDISPEVVWRTVHLTERYWPPYRRLSLVDAYAEQAAGIPFDTSLDLLKVRASLLYDVGRFEEAKDAASEGLAATGHEKLVTASFHNLIGMSCSALGQYEEALPHLEFFHDVAARELGEGHPEFATSCNNLATLLQATNRLEEAEPLMQRVVNIFETSLGADHPNVATSLNNLATLLQATNRLEEAEPLMRRALQIDEQSYGKEHPRVAIDLNNLGQLLKDTNRLEEAEPLMQRVVNIVETSLGADHPNVASSLNNLAQLLQATNRLEEAEPLMRRVVVIFRRFGISTGHEHPHMQTVVANYTALLAQMDFSQEQIGSKLRDLL